LLDGLRERLNGNFHAGEQPRRQAIGLLQQREKYVFAIRFNVAVAERFGLRRLHGLLGFLREFVQIHTMISPSLRLGRDMTTIMAYPVIG
jgi:hypothetical protein